MTDIFLGNLFSLGAHLSDAISGTRKTKKSILITQTVSQLFYIASALALSAYSTAVQNVVSIFRNLYGATDKHNKVIDWILVITPVVMGLYFNNQGLLGLVPIIANLEYSLALLIFVKNPTTLKIAFLICISAFVVFNFIIMNYVGAIAGGIVVITTSISVYNELKKKE